MKTKVYLFKEKGNIKKMTFSELVNKFGGYSYKDEKKIAPRMAKLIVRVNNQGGEITLN